ncbi:hypothetical protein DFH07DRAFT_1013676 [Mycena maculata]|uniref:F-box domain-containing protein n=1 Tax=Mycena maculata TaxID=230809 RepID=A0AAD7JMI1_9AGAR|nr:hypothetical protein DFH07DRAFT_1013676 [Mycena maculata]
MTRVFTNQPPMDRFPNIRDFEHLCLLSALSASDSGPFAFERGNDIADTARTMAAEIAGILGEADSRDVIEKILEESLESSTGMQGVAWMEEYLGYPRADASPRRPIELEDPYFDVAVLIGYQVRRRTEAKERQHVVLRRVADFGPQSNCWRTHIVHSEDGAENRIEGTSSHGIWPAKSFVFCWERPYQYFRDWMRHSCPSLASLDNQDFVEQFFRVIDSNRPRLNYGGSGLLPCISYGGIEKTHSGRRSHDGTPSYQTSFARTRTKSTNTAAAIAAGARGEALWPAFALDFGAWRAMRPDLWPTEPSSLSSISTVTLEPATHSILHTLPPEVLVQILYLVSLSDLLSLLQSSRGISGLVYSLLDETLWDQAHYGDLRWVLPVPGVRGEVERAENAVKGWSANPVGLASAFDSREFPFASFMSECARSGSMRNRRRLWNIYKQYKVLWENMGFDSQGVDHQLERLWSMSDDERKEAVTGSA